jgi:hypothetical protein
MRGFLTPFVLPALCLGFGACDADFSVQRGVLGPFRIAALGAVDGVASVALWSGEGMHHSQAPTLRWTLDGEDLGEGWEVPLTHQGLLGLLVEDPATGETHSAQVDIGQAPGPLRLERAAVDLSAGLDLEDRRTITGEPVDTTVPDGMAARLSLRPEDGVGEGLTTRWMAASGTMLPLTDLQADFVAEVLTWNDGAVDERSALGPGLFGGLALVIDGQGGNRWVWSEVAIGLDAAFFQHEGRLFEGSLPEGSSHVQVVLDWDATGTRIVPTELDPVASAGTHDPLPCAPDAGAFRMVWVAEGRCTVDDVLGIQLILAVGP